jgi:hypothetical protein
MDVTTTGKYGDIAGYTPWNGDPAKDTGSHSGLNAGSDGCQTYPNGALYKSRSGKSAYKSYFANRTIL